MTRHTKIIATIGPASATLDVFSQMVPYIDFARWNASWGTYEEFKNAVLMIRNCAAVEKKNILIIQDLSGPREQGEGEHHYDNNALSVVTEKDKRDVQVGVEAGVDYVALSYVGSADDIRELRVYIDTLGKKIPIIAKIERREALQNLDEIMAESDAVMVARGDLGNAFPIEEIPFIQKDIVTRAKEKGVFVIVATEMLYSMIHSPRPTRAEVTDVEYAVENGADAVMLSDETAKGEYPIEAVKILDRMLSYDEAQEE